jgi:hypothetical protein
MHVQFTYVKMLKKDMKILLLGILNISNVVKVVRSINSFLEILWIDVYCRVDIILKLLTTSFVLEV